MNNDFSSLAGPLAVLLGMGAAIIIISLAIGLLMIISLWKIFTKAGKPGWASLIPFYNTVVLAEIAGQPWWYGLMPLAAFIPYVGWVISFVFLILIYYKLVIAFGKDTGFFIGVMLLPIIFLPILAFSKDIQYTLNQPTSNTQTQIPTN